VVLGHERDRLNTGLAVHSRDVTVGRAEMSAGDDRRELRATDNGQSILHCYNVADAAIDRYKQRHLHIITTSSPAGITTCAGSH